MHGPCAVYARVRRDLFQQFRERHHRQMEEAEGIRDRFHHVAGLRFHIGVKERFADDGECQRGDLLMRCGKNRIKSSWGRGDETEMSPRYS